MAFIFALAVLPVVSAQETTGGIKGYVKDKTGGTVAGAEVEISGPALLRPRKAEADSAGYFYFQLLPPGDYVLTVTSKGFRTYKQTGIQLSAGKLPTYEIALDIGAVTETIEVSAQAADITTSNVAVAITAQDIDTLPHGRSYQSVIGLAPGARQEPLQSSRSDRLRQNGF